MTRSLPCVLALATFLAGCGTEGSTDDTDAAPFDGVQWATDDGGNDHWYRLVVDTSGVSWPAARAAAESEGGYLATVSSDAENDFVYGLAQADVDARVVNTAGFTVGPWLGGFQEGDMEPAGGWRWATSESFDFTAWLSEDPQPNDALGIEDHLVYLYLSTEDSSWGDYPGEPSGAQWQALVQSYVIEWDALP